MDEERADDRTVIIFATAEPYGHYHLRPYAPHLADRAIHLTPYPQPVQGEPAIRITSDLGVLDIASVVVITGGTLNAWTESIAWQAHLRGVPIVFTETAYPLADPLGRPTPPFALITASSSHSQTLIASHLDVNPDNILILGHPHLDGISNIPVKQKRPERARILLISSVDLPGALLEALKVAADILTEAGHQVTVRPHPREALTQWTGYQMSTNPGSDGLLVDIANTDVVVGTPGTAYLVAAAAGRPLITVISEPDNDECQDNFPTLGYTDMSLVTSPTTILETLTSVNPVPRGMLSHFTGPVEGSAARHITMWESVAR